MKKVLVGGCFDILHLGHIRFLSESRKLGDYLVVALESDENVRRMKGEKRPIHSQRERSEMLATLKVVDEIIPLPEMTSDEDYRKLVTDVRPSVIAVTQGDPVLEKKDAHARSVGAIVVVIPKITTPSTSQLTKLLELE